MFNIKKHALFILFLILFPISAAQPKDSGSENKTKEKKTFRLGARSRAGGSNPDGSGGKLPRPAGLPRYTDPIRPGEIEAYQREIRSRAAAMSAERSAEDVKREYIALIKSTADAMETTTSRIDVISDQASSNTFEIESVYKKILKMQVDFDNRLERIGGFFGGNLGNLWKIVILSLSLYAIFYFWLREKDKSAFSDEISAVQDVLTQKKDVVLNKEERKKRRKEIFLFIFLLLLLFLLALVFSPSRMRNKNSNANGKK